MSRLSLLVPLIGLCSGACVTANVEYLSPNRYEPASPDSVTIFADVAELQTDSIAYQRIAMIYLKDNT